MTVDFTPSNGTPMTGTKLKPNLDDSVSLINGYPSMIYNMKQQSYRHGNLAPAPSSTSSSSTGIFHPSISSLFKDNYSDGHLISATASSQWNTLPMMSSSHSSTNMNNKRQDSYSRHPFDYSFQNNNNTTIMNLNTTTSNNTSSFSLKNKRSVPQSTSFQNQYSLLSAPSTIISSIPLPSNNTSLSSIRPQNNTNNPLIHSESKSLQNGLSSGSVDNDSFPVGLSRSLSSPSVGAGIPSSTSNSIMTSQSSYISSSLSGTPSSQYKSIAPNPMSFVSSYYKTRPPPLAPTNYSNIPYSSCQSYKPAYNACYPYYSLPFKGGSQENTFVTVPSTVSAQRPHLSNLNNTEEKFKLEISTNEDTPSIDNTHTSVEKESQMDSLSVIAPEQQSPFCSQGDLSQSLLNENETLFNSHKRQIHSLIRRCEELKRRKLWNPDKGSIGNDGQDDKSIESRFLKKLHFEPSKPASSLNALILPSLPVQYSSISSRLHDLAYEWYNHVNIPQRHLKVIKEQLMDIIEMEHKKINKWKACIQGLLSENQKEYFHENVEEDVFLSIVDKLIVAVTHREEYIHLVRNVRTYIVDLLAVNMKTLKFLRKNFLTRGKDNVSANGSSALNYTDSSNSPTEGDWECYFAGTRESSPVPMERSVSQSNSDPEQKKAVNKIILKRNILTKKKKQLVKPSKKLSK